MSSTKKTSKFGFRSAPKPAAKGVSVKATTRRCRVRFIWGGYGNRPVASISHPAAESRATPTIQRASAVMDVKAPITALADYLQGCCFLTPAGVLRGGERPFRARRRYADLLKREATNERKTAPTQTHTAWCCSRAQGWQTEYAPDPTNPIVHHPLISSACLPPRHSSSTIPTLFPIA